MAWPVIAGIAAGALSAYGQNRAASKQNRAMMQFYSPQRINAVSSAINPGVWGATNSPGFRQSLQAIGENPGYIDPKLQSYAFMQNDRAGQAAIQRLQSMIGRSGGAGGVANANLLASLGMVNMGRASIAQRFALWREQQRRSDLQFLLDQLRASQNTAVGLQSNLAQSYVQPTPWQTTAGNAIQGGLASYSMYKNQQPQYLQGTWGQDATNSLLGK